MRPAPIDLSLFSTDELKELLENVQEALKEEIRAVAGLPPQEMLLSRRLSITKLEKQIIVYREEVERRGAGRDKVKILFLATSPDNLVGLSLHKEIRGVKERLRSGEYRDRFELVSESAVRARDVVEHLLHYKPTIVHISGHGDREGELQFHGEMDRARGVPIDAFAELFANFKSHVSCVVLNACHSDALAEALVRHIDCVVGMTAAVQDDDAIVFAEDFYRALSFGQSLQVAFNLACIAIGLQNPGQQSVPRLYTSPEVRPEKLLLV